MLAKAIPLLASALVVWKITKGQISETADEFWRYMKFDVPLNKIKVDVRLVSPTVIKADLIISNNYTKDIEVSNIVATVFAKKDNGVLVEIARTPPSNKVFTVKNKAKTTISQFPIELSLLTGIQNIRSMLNRPKGDRLLIKFSGNIQNFPISQEVSY